MKKKDLVMFLQLPSVPVNISVGRCTSDLVSRHVVEEFVCKKEAETACSCLAAVRTLISNQFEYRTRRLFVVIHLFSSASKGVQ
jgi:hypothetical protein